MPSLDIVVPCYQYGKYLNDCVGSVVSQGIADLRILIIDNASSDNSFEIAQELARTDSRIQVVKHASNLGHVQSYNEGIEWANADYFTILDADDMLAPGSLAHALQVMERHPKVGFTRGSETLIAYDGSPSGFRKIGDQDDWAIISGRQFIKLALKKRSYVGQSTSLRRTSVQKAVGYYRKEIPYTCDLHMWLRFGLMGDVASTGRLQGMCREHAQQFSSLYHKTMINYFVERTKAIDLFISQEGQELADSVHLQRQARTNLAHHAYWLSLQHMLRGQTDAVDLFRYACKERPMSFFVPPVHYLFNIDQLVAKSSRVLAEAISHFRWRSAK